MRNVFFVVLTGSFFALLTGCVSRQPEDPQVAAALAAQRMQAALFASAEEMLAYGLLPDSDGRQEYLESFKKFDEQSAYFSKAAALDHVNGRAFAARHNELIAAYENYRRAGDEMCAVSESNKSPDPRAVTKFQNELDKAGALSEGLTKAAMLAITIKGPKAEAALKIVRMQTVFFEAAGAAFCYQILGDKSHREAFAVRLKEFSDLLAECDKLLRSSGPEDPRQLELLEQLKTGHNVFLAAGEKMFVAYEKGQKPEVQLVSAFEQEEDRIRDIFAELIERAARQL